MINFSVNKILSIFSFEMFGKRKKVNENSTEVTINDCKGLLFISTNLS